MKCIRILLIMALCSVYYFCWNFSLVHAQSSELMEIRYKNESWLPKPDTTVTVEFKIRRDANCSSATVTAFLANITNYRGECGNVNNGRGTANDMQLTASANSGWTENSPNSITRTVNQSETYYPVVIKCYDHAAYAEITISVSCGSTTQTKILKLPKDDNGNKIADTWETQHNIYTSNTSNAQALVRKDTDPGPDPNLVGDGISVFDEYRGFILQKGNTNEGEFKHLDPKKQDFFISWAANATHKNAGVGDATQLPGNLIAHLVRRSDLQTGILEGMLLNPTWTSTGSQTIYAVPIHEKPYPADRNPQHLDALGDAVVGVPSSASKVNLYLSNITGTKIEIFTQIQDVLAHELGHSVNLNHCPADNSQACYMWNEYQQWSQYMAHHNRDYDVSPAAPNSAPQKEFKTTQGSTPQSPVSPPATGGDPGEDNYCPTPGIVPSGPTESTGPSAPGWQSDYYRSTRTYESDRDYSTNPLVEYPLNLSYLTQVEGTSGSFFNGLHYKPSVSSHENIYYHFEGNQLKHHYATDRASGSLTEGFSVISISPTPVDENFNSIFYTTILNVNGEMKLCINIGNFQCGTYTFTIRARNSAGYADANYVLELTN